MTGFGEKNSPGPSMSVLRVKDGLKSGRKGEAG